MEEIKNSVNEFGTVVIAADVVATIAALAASEVSGVSEMSGGFTEGLAEKFGVKSSSKGIKAQVGEEEAALDIYLIVDYGVSIPNVAREVQDRVKKAVETMTGLKVVEINIHIQNINIPKEPKVEETPKVK